MAVLASERRNWFHAADGELGSVLLVGLLRVAPTRASSSSSPSPAHSVPWDTSSALISVYVGERSLIWSWMLSSSLIPFVGARSSERSSSSFSEQASTPAAASHRPIPSALQRWPLYIAGLFSSQAAEKLKLIFETDLCDAAGLDRVRHRTQRGRRRDRVVHPTRRNAGDPGRDPGRGPGGRDRGLLEARTSPATFDPDAGVLRTILPPGATTAKFTVRVGNTTAESETVFHVKEWPGGGPGGRRAPSCCRCGRKLAFEPPSRPRPNGPRIMPRLGGSCDESLSSPLRVAPTRSSCGGDKLRSPL